MKPFFPSPGGLVAGIPVVAVLISPLSAETLTWDNSDSSGLWSTPANWDTGFLPLSTDDAIFPSGLGGAITLDTATISGSAVFPTARTVQFNDNYTVTGSSFIRPLDVGIGVNTGSQVTWNGPISVGTLTKTGAGTLALGNATNSVGSVVVNSGVLRANVAGSLGTGPVTFANGLGIVAGIDFGSNTGTWANPFSSTGSGEITFLSSALAPNALVLSGAFDLDQNVAFEADGTLEITGPISGSMSLEKSGTGTVILSGTNSFTGYSDVYEGTLRIANDAAWSTSHSFHIETGATLDAAAMTAPVDVSSTYFANVYGSFLGDLTVSGYLEGNGLVDGNVLAQAGSYVLPDYDGQLHVTGDFTLESSAAIDFYLAGITPMLGYNQMRVDGTVTLAGDLLLGNDPVLVGNDSFILLLNDGTDPIHGHFHGLPEGGVVPIGDGLALQVTYQANGDGGAVGNDVGFTVVPDLSSTDLALSVNAPLAVDLASSFSITYTIANLGPESSSASSLEVELPTSATFTGSTPPGSVIDNLLTVPVSALANGSSKTVTLNFTAPAATGSVFVAPWIYNGAGDSNDTNNDAPSVTAVLAGGAPVIDSFTTDPENGTLTLGIRTIPDVRYVFQQSIDLDNWNDLLESLGDGELMQFPHSMNETKEYFRFSILPYDPEGGGTPE